MLSLDSVRGILLDELRAKGYAPNPADVLPAATKLLEIVKESEDAAVAKALEDAKPAPVNTTTPPAVPAVTVPGQKPSV